MEESEKRRERLRAMRMEAAQGGVPSDAGNSIGASHSLTNPLIEASATPPVHSEPFAAPRFDFYTDPMAAFSADKRRSKVSHQISPAYFTPPRPRSADMTSPPAYQAQTTYKADQRVYQSPGSYHGSGPSVNPMETPGSFGTPQGNTNDGGSFSGPSSYGFPSNSRGGGNFRGPGFAQRGSPSFSDPSFAQRGSPSFSGPGFAQRGSPSFSYGLGRGYGFNNAPQAGSDNWGSPYPHSGRGRSQWLGNNSAQTGSGNRGNPYPHSGRGRGRYLGNHSPSSVHSGRRGVGSRDSVSAELRPDLYYDKSMVEDPWEMLEPVIWRMKDAPTSLDTPDSLKSWLPKSITAKKARVSETSNNYRSGRSFAEDLAASFHAAAHYELADEDAK